MRRTDASTPAVSEQESRPEEHALAPGVACAEIFAACPDGIVVLDPHGTVLSANPAAVRMLRPEGRALVGSGFGLTFADPDLTEVELPETGVVAQLRISPSRWRGRAAQLVILRDVTALRRNAEQTTATDLLQQVAQVAGMGAVERDLRTGRLVHTSGMDVVFGTACHDVLSDPLRSGEVLVHPDDQEHWREVVCAALTGRCPVDTHYRIVRPDGQVRTVHHVSELISDDSGAPIKVRTVVQDVTEQRRAVEVLRASEERFRLLAEHSQDVIFLIRMVPRPTVEYVSPACATVLGHSPQELTGDAAEALSVLMPASRSTVLEALKSPDGGPKVYEVRLVDGTPAWLEVRISTIHDDKGRIVAYEGNVRDVTDRVLAEKEQQRLAQQLAQSERLDALGKLAGGVAHDFNNLLAVIKGTAGLLGEDLETGKAEPADVQRIIHAADRGAALTRQLLIFSRGEPSVPQVLSLNSVVESIKDMLQRTIGEDVIFVAHLSLWPTAIRIDRSKLEQIILNLVVNARAAMEQGGRLTLETDQVTVDGKTHPQAVRVSEEFRMPPGTYVRLTVTDTGSGMSPEVVRRAFEPFFTTRKTGLGSGLGLATVHGVVTEAGGYVTIDSRVGIGTTIGVYLPACTEDADSETCMNTVAPRGHGRTVLVVEDEEQVRQVIIRILSRHGYRVLAARDAAQALERYAGTAGGIDVLLTDVIMPGMTGPRLAQELRDAADRQLPVLYISGYSGNKVPAHAPILHKPFDAHTLLRRLDETLHSGTA